jgi:hypothetical protein
MEFQIEAEPVFSPVHHDRQERLNHVLKRPHLPTDRPLRVEHFLIPGASTGLSPPDVQRRDTGQSGEVWQAHLKCLGSSRRSRSRPKSNRTHAAMVGGPN